jgi:small-conductance mechanosensitive channel
MDVQQAINIEILRQFAAEQVSFAFPSRTVYHVKGVTIEPGDTA